MDIETKETKIVEGPIKKETDLKLYSDRVLAGQIQAVQSKLSIKEDETQKSYLAVLLAEKARRENKTAEQLAPAEKAQEPKEE